MWWLSIPSNRNRLIRSLLISATFVGFCIFVLLSLAYIGFRISRVILPGVYVGSQDLSLRSITSAAPLLDERWNQNHQIVLFSSDWQTARKPAQLGLHLNSEITAQRAYELSYSIGFFPAVWRMVGLASERLLVLPAITLDETIAQTGLAEIAIEASIVPQEARFSYDGNEITIQPGIQGRSLDVETNFQALIDDPVVSFLSGYLPASVQPVIPAISDIPNEVLAQAQQIVDQSLVIQAYDPLVDEYYSWEISTESLTASIRLQIQDGRVVLVTDPFPLYAEINAFSATFAPNRWIDQENLEDYFSNSLDANSSILTIRHAATSYTVQPGDTLLIIAWRQGIPLWRILEANPGLDPETLFSGTNLVIPSRTDLIDLPIIHGKRILVDLTDHHLWGFEGDTLIFNEIISTGIDRSPTQPGIFQVRSHVPNAFASVWDLFMPNFIGIYEAWPGFENGFHGLPTLSNGQTLWGGVLGQPVSFGCIILSTNAAQNLYTWAEDGVIVEIRE
ncbi:MAG: L,D-transpeptidase family protein [Anaerolineae bacterium]|nr:L,D-transpeptidase family protein [Anaerolineae bacterium]